MKKKLYLSVLLGTMLLTCACGSKEDIVTDTNSGQETNATVMTEVAQTEVTEVLETEAPDLSNENGYGFTISEACFEAYLSYVESGYAASVYKDAEHHARRNG